MEDILLTVHILSAAAWIGASMFLGFAGPRFAQIGGPAAGGWLSVVQQAIPKFLLPAGILTLLTGMGIVLVEDAWGWGDPFVGIGIGAVVVALAIGLGNNAPNIQRALDAFGSGDMAAAGAAVKRVSTGGLVIVLLLIATEYVMVLRLGAG